ncbi:MAG TPA: hypothetical protein PKA88_31315, partial [Polyangiaceae bacterium]|nr:hypothetical protein [Polyangiaceae bacterium]
PPRSRSATAGVQIPRLAAISATEVNAAQYLHGLTAAVRRAPLLIWLATLAACGGEEFGGAVATAGGAGASGAGTSVGGQGGGG